MPVRLRLPALLAVTALLGAAEGELDPSWTGPDGSDAGASVLQVSADGFFDQILSGPAGALYGRISHGNNIAETSIVRFTGSGAYDDAFGDGGRVVLGAGGAFGSLKWGRDLALTATGQLLVLIRGGRLLCLDADGAADPDFGVDGIEDVLVDILSYDTGEYGDFVDLHVDPADGSLWVAGWVQRQDGTDRNMVLVHLDATGAVDEHFAVDGVFEYDADGRYDQAAVVRSDGAGRIWLGGRVTVGESDVLKQGAVIALDDAGARRSAVGTDGRILVDFGRPTDFSAVTRLLLRSDGVLIVAGSVAEGSALIAVEDSGAVASAFRPASLVPRRIEDLALRSDGGLVLISDIDQRTVITRLLPDGSADTGFGGGDGQMRLRIVSNQSKTSPQSCLIDADGDLVITGTYATELGTGVFDPWIGRLLMDPPADAPQPLQRRLRIVLDREAGVRPVLETDEQGIEEAPLQWVFEGLQPISTDRTIVFQAIDAG